MKIMKWNACNRTNNKWTLKNLYSKWNRKPPIILKHNSTCQLFVKSSLNSNYCWIEQNFSITCNSNNYSLNYISRPFLEYVCFECIKCYFVNYVVCFRWKFIKIEWKIHSVYIVYIYYTNIWAWQNDILRLNVQINRFYDFISINPTEYFNFWHYFMCFCV